MLIYRPQLTHWKPSQSMCPALWLSGVVVHWHCSVDNAPCVDCYFLDLNVILEKWWSIPLSLGYRTVLETNIEVTNLLSISLIGCLHFNWLIWFFSVNITLKNLTELNVKADNLRRLYLFLFCFSFSFPLRSNVIRMAVGHPRVKCGPSPRLNWRGWVWCRTLRSGPSL